MSKSINKVKDSLLPLIWLNNLYGFTVFEIQEENPCPKLSFLYSIGKFIPYGFTLWYGLNIISQKYLIIPIIFAVMKVIIFISLITLVIPTVSSFKYYKTFKEFTKKVSTADTIFAIFGIDPEYEESLKEHKKLVFQWIIGALTLLSLSTIMFYYIFQNFYDALIFVIAFEYPLVANPIVELNLLICLNVVGRRFEKLNALIQSISTCPLQLVNSRLLSRYQCILNKNEKKVEVKSRHCSSNRTNIGLVLKIVRQVHLGLCETSRKMNNVFGKQMTLQTATTFILLTGFSYCIYIISKEQNMSTVQRLMYYCNFGLWIVASIIRTIRIVRASTYTSLEANRTGQIAHEIQLSRLQKKYADEIQQLSLQIMQYPLKFTANDMFVLDFNYIQGFIGSVVTYFMILITNQSDVMKAAHTLAKNFGNNETLLNNDE